MHDGGDDQPHRIDQQMPLAASDLLASVIAAWAGRLCCLHRLLSMMPADGLASRPSISRTRITKAWLMRNHVPSSRQR